MAAWAFGCRQLVHPCLPHLVNSLFLSDCCDSLYGRTPACWRTLGACIPAKLSYSTGMRPVERPRPCEAVRRNNSISYKFANYRTFICLLSLSLFLSLYVYIRCYGCLSDLLITMCIFSVPEKRNKKYCMQRTWENHPTLLWKKVCFNTRISRMGLIFRDRRGARLKLEKKKKIKIKVSGRW